MNYVVKTPPDPEDGRNLRRVEDAKLLKMTQSGIYLSVTPQLFEQIKKRQEELHQQRRKQESEQPPEEFETQDSAPIPSDQNPDDAHPQD